MAETAIRLAKGPIQDNTSESYRIREVIIVRDLPEGERRVEVWMPVPQSDALQQVREVTVESDADLSLHFDREWGNAILFGRGTPAREFRAALEYRISRREAPAEIDPARALPLSGASGPYHRSLMAERHVRVDEETQEKALRLVGAERNPLNKARIFYDHVRGYMTYDQAKQSWQSGTLSAGSRITRSIIRPAHHLHGFDDPRRSDQL